jgi:hypothetical protein
MIFENLLLISLNYFDPSFLFSFFWLFFVFPCFYSKKGMYFHACKVSQIILLFFLLSWFGILRSYRSKLQMQLSDNHFLPDLFFERVSKGQVTVNELERRFNPPRFVLQSILSPISKGFVGINIRLENGLIDVRELFYHTIRIFTEELLGATPTLQETNEIIGYSFRDIAIHFAWELPEEYLDQIEFQFYKLMNELLPYFHLSPLDGATTFLEEAIQDNNAITIMTSLPSEIAFNLIKQSNYASLLDNRVDPRHLIAPTSLQQLEMNIQQKEEQLQQEQETQIFQSIKSRKYEQELENIYNPKYGDRFYQQQLLQICAIVEKPPMQILALETHLPTMIACKKLGISCIAFRSLPKLDMDMINMRLKRMIFEKGFPHSGDLITSRSSSSSSMRNQMNNKMDGSLIRSADMIVDHWSEITLTQIYKVILFFSR